VLVLQQRMLSNVLVLSAAAAVGCLWHGLDRVEQHGWLGNARTLEQVAIVDRWWPTRAGASFSRGKQGASSERGRQQRYFDPG